MSVATERAALFAQGLEIETRESWGAQCDYRSTRSVVTPAKWLFLHVSVTERSGDPARDMRTIERIGQSRFGIGCSYNAAASQDGRLWEMQPLGRRGAHTVNDLPNPRFPEGSLNYLARALVLPQQVDDVVTDAQVDAAARWGAALCRAGLAAPGAPWFGHRDVTRKGCPGDHAYTRLRELNDLTRHYEQNGLESDMPLSAADLHEIQKAVLALFTSDPSMDAAVKAKVRSVLAGAPDALDETEVARLVLSGLGDVVLSSEQVRSIIDAMPQAVKQALREGVG